MFKTQNSILSSAATKKKTKKHFLSLSAGSSFKKSLPEVSYENISKF